VKYDPSTINPYYYIDTQGQPFTIDLYDAYNQNIASKDYTTNIERDDDGTANGFGWKMVYELAMENYDLGFYRETVTFNNFFQYDEGAKENFLILGYKNFAQSKLDYVIMVGIDGVRRGNVTITIEDEDFIEPINNGAAIFTSSTWPLDMEGKFSIKITNSEGVSHTYYRTILEAGTFWGYFQQQFAIIDKNFDGIEETQTVVGDPIPYDDINQSPTVTLAADPASGEVSLLVNFTASASDSDGTIESYKWDFDGDGIYDETGTSGEASHIYNVVGTYTAKVKVTDNEGATAETMVSIVVNNSNSGDTGDDTTDTTDTSSSGSAGGGGGGGPVGLLGICLSSLLGWWKRKKN
jgi:PKD repeat protein